MIQFYKPNPKVTGSACSFWHSTEEKCVFASMIKQDSWDASRKTGSFSKNKGDAKNIVIIKFSMIEASGLIDAIERNTAYTGYHTSKKQILKFNFSPYVNKVKNEQVGFSFSINKESKEDSTDKSSFIIGLLFPEARHLKEYLLFSTQRIFEKNVYKGKNSKGDNAPKPKQEESPSNDPLDEQEW